jgi:hypothetical protein
MWLNHKRYRLLVKWQFLLRFDSPVFSSGSYSYPYVWFWPEHHLINAISLEEEPGDGPI